MAEKKTIANKVQCRARCVNWLGFHLSSEHNKQQQGNDKNLHIT